MGRLFGFFQSDKKAEIEKDIKKLETKKAEIEAEINACYERLDKLESESESNN